MKQLPSPASIRLDSLQEIHAAKLGILDVFERGARAQREVTCSAGCSACCYQAVLVQPYEAAMLAIALGPDDLSKVIGQGHRQAEVLKDFTSEAQASEWFARGEPCALMMDGRCSAYMVRPAACGLVLSVSPRETCHTSFSELIDIVDAAPEIRACAALERRWRGEPRWGIMGVMLAEELGRMDTIPAVMTT